MPSGWVAMVGPTSPAAAVKISRRGVDMPDDDAWCATLAREAAWQPFRKPADNFISNFLQY